MIAQNELRTLSVYNGAFKVLFDGDIYTIVDSSITLFGAPSIAYSITPVINVNSLYFSVVKEEIGDPHLTNLKIKVSILKILTPIV